MYRKYIKRFFDILCALLAIICLCWLYAILTLIVRLKLGSPILFQQERPGKDGKIFRLYKFRSMKDARDEHGALLPDNQRLTRFGKILRSTSLDELPELFNILKGDMSIVGPRPQLVRDLVFMTEEQKRRHSVRPGLTGLAQVNGRNNIPWERKFEYDLAYIDSGISFLKDIKILFITISKVLKRSDVAREGTISDVDFGDWLLDEGKICKGEYDRKMEEATRLLQDFLDEDIEAIKL